MQPAYREHALFERKFKVNNIQWSQLKHYSSKEIVDKVKMFPEEIRSTEWSNWANAKNWRFNPKARGLNIVYAWLLCCFCSLFIHHGPTTAHIYWFKTPSALSLLNLRTSQTVKKPTLPVPAYSCHREVRAMAWLDHP